EFVDERFLSGVRFGALSAMSGAVVVHVPSFLEFCDHAAPAVPARDEAAEGEVAPRAFGLVLFALVQQALDAIPCLFAREGLMRPIIRGPVPVEAPTVE